MAADAPRRPRIDLDTFLDDLADRIAERVVARVAPDPSTRWASARDNPIGSACAFLDAARRGDFSTGKRGREIVARWADVEAYIAARGTIRKPRSADRETVPANANAAPMAGSDPTARRLAQLAAAGALPRGDADADGAPRARRARGT